MTPPQDVPLRTRAPLSHQALSLITGGFDDLHRMVETLAGGGIALLFLDEDTRCVNEVVVLGTIARAYVKDSTLYMDLRDAAASTRYGSIHHELGKAYAWTGHGHRCVPIVDRSGSLEDMVGLYRRSVPDDAFIDFTART